MNLQVRTTLEVVHQTSKMKSRVSYIYALKYYANSLGKYLFFEPLSYGTLSWTRQIILLK